MKVYNMVATYIDDKSILFNRRYENVSFIVEHDDVLYRVLEKSMDVNKYMRLDLAIKNEFMYRLEVFNGFLHVTNGCFSDYYILKNNYFENQSMVLNKIIRCESVTVRSFEMYFEKHVVAESNSSCAIDFIIIYEGDFLKYIKADKVKTLVVPKKCFSC